MLTESQIKPFNGSVFQTDGAATRKERQAKLVFANGTERSGRPTEDERVIIDLHRQWRNRPTVSEYPAGDGREGSC